MHHFIIKCKFKLSYGPEKWYLYILLHEIDQSKMSNHLLESIKKSYGIYLFLINITVTVQSQHIHHTSISRWSGIVCLFVYAIHCVLDFFNPYHIRSSIVSFINVIVNTPHDKTWPSQRLYQLGHFRSDMRQRNCGIGGDHCRQKSFLAVTLETANPLLRKKHHWNENVIIWWYFVVHIKLAKWKLLMQPVLKVAVIIRNYN